MTPRERRPASGTQHLLRSGDYQAVAASVGASLRVLRHSGPMGERDLVVPFDADEVRPAYRGVTLAPWPNRIVDGRYRFGGIDHVLPLTEPERGHALHGLVSWLDFEAVDKGADHVTLAAEIEPQTGYPWRICIESTFRLSEGGLEQTVTGTNMSDTVAPFGISGHPYLVAGPGRVDDWTLELPADVVLGVTEDRLIPTTEQDVDAHDARRFDFRRPRRIGDARIDHAFTGLRWDDGMARVRVTDASGSGVSLAWDGACPWVQVHTADMPGRATDRIGLAVEPMTCPPDAFNSENSLIYLDPASRAGGSWTIASI
ncbi:Galactose mutarotase [Microbacterium sp. C448]|uniref:aldose 1-epimerase family protein n=1 Tax=Microbacterium sp. C448 TaxID=1177594 RepID=UPI0003DDFA3B|nr:aldose 1-epimerase family protein [Microbacterium sp. C448]CDJ98996.1 Galactose mutarotase [Microbacterium sp. C448]